MKLGDAVAMIATPIARTFGLPCVDPETNELRPESKCNKRIQRLNNFSDSFWDQFFKPPKE